MAERYFVGFCVELTDDLRSWEVIYLFSDDTEEDGGKYSASAEGVQEMFEHLAQLTSARAKPQ